VADEPDPSALFEQIKGFDVQQFLIATSSTLASLAFAKLESKELSQAKTAIDAVAALVPLVEGDLARDLKGALANLQLAYATAAAG
jgi:glutamate racemase